MALGYDQFLGALNTLQATSMEGDDAAVKKFTYAIDNLMPDSLNSGKYKSLGNLLKKLSKEFMPLTMTQYYAKEADQNRLISGIRDILETVDYVIRQLVADTENVGEIVSETLTNLGQRLKKMEKTKAKFVFTGVRDGMDQLFKETTTLPGKIDEYLGKGDFRQNEKKSFADISDPLIFMNPDSLLSTIYRAEPNGTDNLDAHQTHYATVEIVKLYQKISRSSLQHAIKSAHYDLKGMKKDLKKIICDGIIHEDYWDKFKETLPDSYEMDKQFEGLKNTFSKEIINQHENPDDELLSISLFTITDWMEWASSMYMSIPLLTATRKNLMFYRNLTFEILKEINAKRDLIHSALKEVENGDEAFKKLKGWENTLITTGKSDVKPALKQYLAGLKLNLDEPVEEIIDTIHMTHQMLWVIDKEVKVLIRVSNDFFENDGANVLVGDLGNPMFQLENLLNHCALSIQQNVVTPTKYTPLFNSMTRRMTVNDVDLIIKKLRKVFPKMHFPIETFSFKKPLSFKAKEIMEEFTPKNFSSKISKLRDEYKDFKNGTSKLKILLMPGLGDGSYDESSNTLIVPLFHKKNDFDDFNFYGALADYLYTTRRTQLGDGVFMNLWNILLERKLIPPQVMINNQRYILGLAIIDLMKANSSNNLYQNYTKELEPAFNAQPNSIDIEGLNSTLTDLVGEYKSL